MSYSLITGSQPLLLSMPHNGSEFPAEVAAQLLPAALQSRDSDWFMHRLYDFASDLGCSVINPAYSRYVIDLNRPASGETLYPGADNTGLCPTSAFDYAPLYPVGHEPDAAEIKRRVTCYWQPYHQALQAELQRICQRHGGALLFDAHSIASQVPRFFSGQLPDFNIGTNAGQSCGQNLSGLLTDFDCGHYSKVINGRFKGGYITREYGRPQQQIEAVQLELSQATYLNETDLSWDQNHAKAVQPLLRQLLESLLSAAPVGARQRPS